MFNDSSRYKGETPYRVEDRRGRLVEVVPVPAAPQVSLLGYHRLQQGQRLDHLAYLYTGDAAGFWRVAEMNDVMLPESLSEQSEIAIPQKTR